jgi:hypothetical protein
MIDDVLVSVVFDAFVEAFVIAFGRGIVEWRAIPRPDSEPRT